MYYVIRPLTLQVEDSERDQRMSPQSDTEEQRRLAADNRSFGEHEYRNITGYSVYFRVIMTFNCQQLDRH